MTAVNIQQNEREIYQFIPGIKFISSLLTVLFFFLLLKYYLHQFGFVLFQKQATPSLRSQSECEDKENRDTIKPS